MSTTPLAGRDATIPFTNISMQGIVYGFSTCMFVMTVWILTSQRNWRTNRVMLATAFVLWALPTSRICMDIYLNITAFTQHYNDGPGNQGPEQWLSQSWMPILLANNAVYAASTLIGDAVVIYRCYVVWQRWWIVVIPCLAWLGAVGAVSYVIDSFDKRKINGNDVIFLYIFTYIANLTATLALAYRIWTVDRATTQHSLRSRSSTSSLRPVAAVIIESGAIYALTLTFALITALHALEVKYVINSFIPAIISITFNMIFMRIGLKGIVETSGARTSTFGGVISGLVFERDVPEESQDTTMRERQKYVQGISAGAEHSSTLDIESGTLDV